MSHRLTDIELKELKASQRDLYMALPELLPEDERLKFNKGASVSGERSYTYGDMLFVVPDQVMRPSAASETLISRIESGELPVTNSSILIMGCGCGVEAVLAARKAPALIVASDICPASVKATQMNFSQYVDTAGASAFSAIVSDLFDQLPEDLVFDRILFNPPAVDLSSHDPVLSRTHFAGRTILFRFFEQLKKRPVLLAENGVVNFVISNTTDLKEVVGYVIRAGFSISLVGLHTWSEPYEKLLTHVFEARVE
jgi:release factor glutamine methyltransferase